MTSRVSKLFEFVPTRRCGRIAAESPSCSKKSQKANSAMSGKDRELDSLFRRLLSADAQNEDFYRLSKYLPHSTHNEFFVQVQPEVFLPTASLTKRLAEASELSVFRGCSVKRCDLDDAETSMLNAISDNPSLNNRTAIVPFRAFSAGIVTAFVPNSVSVRTLLLANHEAVERNRRLLSQCYDDFVSFAHAWEDLNGGFASDYAQLQVKFDFAGRLSKACNAFSSTNEFASLGYWQPLVEKAIRSKGIPFYDPKPANYIKQISSDESAYIDSPLYKIDFDWMLITAPISLQVAVLSATYPIAWANEADNEGAVRNQIVQWSYETSLEEVDFVLFYHLFRNFTKFAQKWREQTACKEELQGIYPHLLYSLNINKSVLGVRFFERVIRELNCIIEQTNSIENGEWRDS